MTHPEPRHKLTVKIGDALRTIQGYTMEEFKMARAEAFDDLKEDLELVQMAKAVVNVAPVVAVQTPATPSSSEWETAPAAPAAPAATSEAPLGPDGRPRVPRSGAGAKGPWKAWFTAARKGEPGYADPIWLPTPGRKDFDPVAWANFPA
jgi:hypothetical protein